MALTMQMAATTASLGAQEASPSGLRNQVSLLLEQAKRETDLQIKQDLLGRAFALSQRAEAVEREQNGQ